MNPQATQQIEAITGALTLPIPVAAQLLGISVRAVRQSMPIVAKGYRTKGVTVAAMREYIAKHSTTPTYVERK